MIGNWFGSWDVEKVLFLMSEKWRTNFLCVFDNRMMTICCFFVIKCGWIMWKKTPFEKFSSWLSHFISVILLKLLICICSVIYVGWFMGKKAVLTVQMWRKLSSWRVKISHSNFFAKQLMTICSCNFMWVCLLKQDILAAQFLKSKNFSFS